MSSEIKANVISEVTSANGVSIDGVTIKDSQVPASAGSSLVFISKGVASTSSQIEFTGLNTLTQYDNLHFILTKLVPSSNNVEIEAQIATSGTTYLTSNYHCSGTRSTNSATDRSGSTIRILRAPFIGDDGFVSGTVDLLGHSETSKITCCNYHLGGPTHDDDVQTISGSGIYDGSNLAVTAIRFKFEGTTTIVTGTIAMYGVKNA